MKKQTPYKSVNPLLATVLTLLALLLAACDADAIAEMNPMVPTVYAPQAAPDPRSGPSLDAMPEGVPEAITFTLESAPGPQCADDLPEDGGDPPGVRAFRDGPGSAYGKLCVYGLSLTRPFTLTISDAGGNVLASDRFEIRGLGTGYYDVIGENTREARGLLPDGDARTVDGVDVIEMRLWLPAGGPTAPWQVMADNGRTQVEGNVSFEAAGAPLVSALPARDINPLLDESCPPVVAGDAVRLAWANIGAGRPLLGVYYLIDFDTEADLRTGQLVYVDQAAGAQDDIVYRIPQDDPTGLYYVLVGDPGQFGDPGYAPPCFEVVNPATPTPPVGDKNIDAGPHPG